MSDQLFLVPITIKTLKRRGIVFNRRDIKRGCFLEGDNYERITKCLQETSPYLFEGEEAYAFFPVDRVAVYRLSTDTQYDDVGGCWVPTMHFEDWYFLGFIDTNRAEQIMQQPYVDQPEDAQS